MPFCLVLLLKAFGGAVIYGDQSCFGSPLSETQQGDSKKLIAGEFAKIYGRRWRSEFVSSDAINNSKVKGTSHKLRKGASTMGQTTSWLKKRPRQLKKKLAKALHSSGGKEGTSGFNSLRNGMQECGGTHKKQLRDARQYDQGQKDIRGQDQHVGSLSR